MMLYLWWIMFILVNYLVLRCFLFFCVCLVCCGVVCWGEWRVRGGRKECLKFLIHACPTIYLMWLQALWLKALCSKTSAWLFLHVNGTGKEKVDLLTVSLQVIKLCDFLIFPHFNVFSQTAKSLGTGRCKSIVFQFESSSISVMSLLFLVRISSKSLRSLSYEHIIIALLIDLLKNCYWFLNYI